MKRFFRSLFSAMSNKDRRCYKTIELIRAVQMPSYGNKEFWKQLENLEFHQCSRWYTSLVVDYLSSCVHPLLTPMNATLLHQLLMAIDTWVSIWFSCDSHLHINAVYESTCGMPFKWHQRTHWAASLMILANLQKPHVPVNFLTYSCAHTRT